MSFGPPPSIVTLAHGTVAVTWGGGTEGYGVDTGRRLWRTASAGS